MPPAPAGLAARVSGGRGRSTSGPPYSRPSSRPSAPPSRPPGAACLRQVQARPFAGAGASVLKRALLRVKRQAPELRKGFLESGGPSLDGESSQGSTNHCVLGNTCVPPFQVKWASFILSIKRELSEPADSVRGIALGAAGTMIHRVKNEPSPWDGCSLVGEKANLLQTALCSCVPHRPASLSGSGDGHRGDGWAPGCTHTDHTSWWAKASGTTRSSCPAGSLPRARVPAAGPGVDAASSSDEGRNLLCGFGSPALLPAKGLLV